MGGVMDSLFGDGIQVPKRQYRRASTEVVASGGAAWGVMEVDEDALAGYLGLGSTFYMTKTGAIEDRLAATQIQAAHRGASQRRAAWKPAGTETVGDGSSTLY